MSLRIKLICPYLVVIAAIFVFKQGYLHYSAHQLLEREQVEKIRLFTQNISHSIKDALAVNDKHKAQTIANELFTLETVEAVQLYNKENKLIFLSDKNGGLAPIVSPLEIMSAHTLPNNYSYTVEPIVHGGNLLASLIVTSLNQPIITDENLLLKEAVTLAVLLMISGILLYFYIGRIIIKPLMKLNVTVQNLTHEHTNYVQMQSHSKDEVGELVYSFDRMMVKLLQYEKQRNHSLEALKQKSSISEDVIESIQYSLLITNHLGSIIHCNSSTYSIFEKTRDELLQTNIRDLIKTKMSTKLDHILDTGEECSDVKLRSVDHKHQYSLTRRFLSKQGHLLFEVRDITELEDVKNRERIAGRVFENSQDGLVVINDNGLISIVNPAVTKLLGRKSEQLVGHSFVTAIRSHKLRKMLPSIIKSIDNFGIWQGEVVEQSVSSRLVPLFAKVNRILKCEKNGLYDTVIVLTDLSDTKEMERLEYLTHHDSLTGLANRCKFQIVLDELVQRSSYVRDEFAVLFLDLDGFKAVNDTYGHDAGDAVLKIVAERMTSITRHTDLIARLAGDEFVMLINPANQAIVTRVSEQLIESISAPISYKGDTLNVGVSIGIKLAGQNECDADLILKSADTAMYRAKKSGKGRAIVMG